jgi:Na+/H+ antiporter NhaD/arsenite permease-like protein
VGIAKPAGADKDRVSVHYPLLLKTAAAVGVMLIAFLAGVPMALVAIGGAAYSLFTRQVKPEKVYREVNWQLLVLFVGLFVLTGGIEQAGLVEGLVGWADAVGLHRPVILTVATAVLSNLVSNVPAVLLLKPLIPSFGEPDRGWLILAMARRLLATSRSSARSRILSWWKWLVKRASRSDSSSTAASGSR